MARIYDKRAEQAVQGKPVDVDTWIRFEFETKGKLADALCRAVLADGAQVVIGQVNRRLRFAVNPGGDTNRRRWPTVAWWSDFIEDLEPGASLLCGEKPVRTIESMTAAMARQYGPTAAAIMEAERGDMAWLVELVRAGRERMKPHHRAAIVAYERQAVQHA